MSRDDKIARALRYLAMIVAIAVTGCGSDGDGPPEVTALRAALPGVSGDAPAGSSVFVGVDTTGQFGVALVRQGDDVVAYVCDGIQIGAWFTGTALGIPISLSSAAGSFEATIGGDQASGTATVAGVQIDFAIVRAIEPAGLRRLADGEVETGRVVTNDNKVFGVTKKKKAVVAGSADESTGAAGVGTSPFSGGVRGLIRKARCATIVLKFQALERDELFGEGSSSLLQQMQDLKDRFGALHCEDFFVI